MFIIALFTMGSKIEATQESIGAWVDKQSMVYAHDGLLFSLKNLTYAMMWMNLKEIMLSKVS
jgi:hypothetical protein